MYQYWILPYSGFNADYMPYGCENKSGVWPIQYIPMENSRPRQPAPVTSQILCHGLLASVGPDQTYDQPWLQGRYALYTVSYAIKIGIFKSNSKSKFTIQVVKLPVSFHLSGLARPRSLLNSWLLILEGFLSSLLTFNEGLLKPVFVWLPLLTHLSTGRTEFKIDLDKDEHLKYDCV